MTISGPSPDLGCFCCILPLPIRTPDMIVAANVMGVEVDCASAEMMSFFWTRYSSLHLPTWDSSGYHLVYIICYLIAYIASANIVLVNHILPFHCSAYCFILITKSTPVSIQNGHSRTDKAATTANPPTGGVLRS